jgi:hypothetical protein
LKHLSAEGLMEGEMNEGSRVLGAALVGAAAGGMLGYLYLTGSGRRFLEQLEPKLDDLANEFRQMRRTIGKAQVAASEGWRSLTDIAGGNSPERQQPRDWSPQNRQATPF